MAAMADVSLTSAQIWQGLGAVALLGAGFGALQAGFVGALIGMPGGVAASLMALRLNRHRRDRVIEGQLPGFLEAIARGLRTGLQLGPATVEAAASTPPPLGQEVEPLAAELQQGLGSAEVFERVVLPESTFAGKTLAEISLPGALVVAMQRAEEIWVPHGGDVIEVGDLLVFFSLREAIDGIIAALDPPPEPD